MALDYTLKQAISIYELAIHNQWQHQLDCNDCSLLSLEMDDMCEKGWQIERSARKWKRNIKRVAKQEGVKITV